VSQIQGRRTGDCKAGGEWGITDQRFQMSLLRTTRADEPTYVMHPSDMQ
jgi:hypothetical protein